MDNNIKVADRVEEQPINEVVSRKQGLYAMYTIASRAIPSVVDGMKPVQRRFIYQAFRSNLKPSGRYVKSGKVAGDTMSRLHPHSRDAIYGAAANMAAPWARVKLIDGKGAFGLTFGDVPAADRYTELKLSEEGWAFAEELGHNAVKMIPTFDNEDVEPINLPSPWPNLLVNGAKGIAVGFACNIPQHNPLEVVKACRVVLKKNGKATVDDILKVMPGPDWATGGELVDSEDGIRDYYENGNGKLTIRGSASIEGNKIVISELPYGVSPGKLIEQVRAKVSDGKLQGIGDIGDMSDRVNGLRVEVTVRRGMSPTNVIAMLASDTDFQTGFSINATALDKDGVPVVFSVIDVIDSFIDMRHDVVINRSKIELDKLRERRHIINGIKAVIADLDTTLKIIRSSDKVADAVSSLKKKFKIDDTQADYVMQMPLRRLTGQDSLELEREEKELIDRENTLDGLINDPAKRAKEIDSHLAAWEKKFKDVKRLTRLDGESIEVDESVASGSQQELPEGEWGVLPDGFLGSAGTPLSSGTAYAVWPDGRIKAFAGKGLPKNISGVQIAPDISDLLVAGVTNGDVALVSRAGRIIRLSLDKINPQGIAGRGVAGMKIGEDDEVIAAFPISDDSAVLTVSEKTWKVTAGSDIPTKGRGGQGVVVHQFNKGDTKLTEAVGKDSFVVNGKEVTPVKRSARPQKGFKDWS